MTRFLAELPSDGIVGCEGDPDCYVFNSFVMNLFPLFMYVYFAHQCGPILSLSSCVSCRFVCLPAVLSKCVGLYMVFIRFCRIICVRILWLPCLDCNYSFCCPDTLVRLAFVPVGDMNLSGLLRLWWSAFSTH